RSSDLVNRAVNDAGFLTDVLHDVDLAACRPADLIDVVTEHPEGRPHPLTVGNFDAGFKAAVGLGKFAEGFETRRGVVSFDSVWASVLFRQRPDHQIAIMHRCVLSAIGVVLKLLVAPALAAGFNNPLGAINRGSVGTVELVAPNQCPAAADWGSCRVLRKAGYRPANNNKDDERTQQEKPYPCRLHKELRVLSALRENAAFMKGELAHYCKQTRRMRWRWK